MAACGRCGTFFPDSEKHECPTWCRTHGKMDSCPEHCPRCEGYFHGDTDCRYAHTTDLGISMIEWKEQERERLSNVAPQPDPKVQYNKPSIWQGVIEDMKLREQQGILRYGTPLQTGNGRDPLVDAYQEALDLAVYLRQEIDERRERVSESTLPENESLQLLYKATAGIAHDLQYGTYPDCVDNSCPMHPYVL